MKLTVVAMELVCLSTHVMAEMSDGSVVTLSLPWGCPKEADINRCTGLGWKYKTRDQLIELARSYNASRRSECNSRLHDDKVRRLGWDYASRGY